ncbi:MAG: acyl-CoA thioesterase [Treponema sp.]|jgi:acyl-CoA thioester hydrolase|nr:acyl-CoA thioesterase [Treponema sp.]
MFSVVISPRFGDVDGLGHINNVALACWFETARNPLFAIVDPSLTINRETWPLIMAHTDYDFVNQIHFRDVEIRSFVDRIGTKSFTICHEAWQEGRLCAAGRAVLVYFNFQTNQSRPIPEEIKRKLAGHLRPPSAGRV